MSRTVVIAGGGPTGLMLASELGLAGVQAVVVERLAEPSGYSRSLTLQARAREVLEQRGLTFFHDYPPVPSYNFGLIELHTLVDQDLLPLLLPQRDVERVLEKRAVELGAEVRRGQEITGFTQDDDGVTVTVRDADHEYEIRAAYLVGCDGGSSIVRKLAGIGFPGTASTINGLTSDLLTAPDVREFVPPTLNQRGMYAVVPLGAGRYRVTCLEFGVEKTGKDVAPTVEEFQASLERVSGKRLELLETGEARYVSRFGNATRLAERYRVGRVFIAGDACHIHLPVSGQGLNTGIQDAMNLGWKLAADLAGWAPEGLLDTYHDERHPVGERVCMNTRAQDALMHPLDRVAPLRELFADLMRFPAVSRYLIEMVTGLSIRYPVEGPEPAADAHPLLGRRIPDAALTLAGSDDGGTTVARLMHTGHGLLLHLGGRQATATDTVAGTGWADRIDTVTAGPVPEIDAATVLVRPDGYVAYAGDGAGLRDALTAWFGAPTA